MHGPDHAEMEVDPAALVEAYEQVLAVPARVDEAAPLQPPGQGRGVHAIENPGVADGNLADRLVQDAAVQAASVDLDVGQFGHDAAFQAARSQSAWTLSGLPTVSAWRQPRSRSG